MSGTLARLFMTGEPAMPQKRLKQNLNIRFSIAKDAYREMAIVAKFCANAQGI
jgi:hypothetical protein